MKTIKLSMLSLLILSLGFPATPGKGQTMETHTVEAAAFVLSDIMTVPARRIPESLLAEAEAIAIIPNLVKGGFVVGVRHGRGVVLMRDPNGAWQPPTFVKLTGGSVGWQAGVQSIDVILVFMTRESAEGLWRGKFTIGADVAAAAGPIGRQAAAATDARLRAEIYSYSRSRGLFAGVSLDGSALQIDHRANAVYYRSSGFAPNTAVEQLPAPIPPSALRLMEQVARYTDTTGSPPSYATGSDYPTPAAIVDEQLPEADSVRQQLARSAEVLSEVLDDRWNRYLALPAEVYTSDRHASADAIRQTLGRFNRVADDSRYQPLVDRPEFQATYDLLRQYLSSLSSPQPRSIVLPPPPSSPTTGAASR